MRNLNNFIIEKLKLNKDTNPEKIDELINFISIILKQECLYSTEKITDISVEERKDIGDQIITFSLELDNRDRIKKFLYHLNNKLEKEALEKKFKISRAWNSAGEAIKISFYEE